VHRAEGEPMDFRPYRISGVKMSDRMHIPELVCDTAEFKAGLN